MHYNWQQAANRFPGQVVGAQMNRRQPVRIADVAREAEVGAATVDRVLNYRHGVSEAMDRRIRRAMEFVTARTPGQGRDRPQPRRHHFQILPPMENKAGPSCFARFLQSPRQANRVAATGSFVERVDPVTFADQLKLIRAGRCRDCLHCLRPPCRV